MGPSGESGVHESREFPRYGLGMAVKVGQGPDSLGRVLDVSKRGARVATKKAVKVGERVGLELFLRETDPFPIRLVGECRWTCTADPSETIVGIDLSASHSRNLNVLDRFLMKYFR